MDGQRNTTAAWTAAARHARHTSAVPPHAASLRGPWMAPQALKSESTLNMRAAVMAAGQRQRRRGEEHALATEGMHTGEEGGQRMETSMMGRRARTTGGVALHGRIHLMLHLSGGADIAVPGRLLHALAAASPPDRSGRGSKRKVCFPFNGIRFLRPGSEAYACDRERSHERDNKAVGAEE